MKLTLPLVLLEFFVLLGILISCYTIHLENEIIRNSGCGSADDCNTCNKLPGKFIAECVDSQCYAVMQQGFVCKGKPEGFSLAQGGVCRSGKHWMPCPEYEAMCDLGEWSKCSKVFGSPWSHILVHWGVAKEGSALDFTLPQLGVCWFVLLSVYPFVHRKHRLAPTLYSLLCAGSLCFNGYLGWVLKTKLHEFCIVCFSTYIVNCSSVLCVWSDWRASTRAEAKAPNGKVPNGRKKKVKST